MAVLEGTVTYPGYDWIPNPDQITDSAAAMLEVVGGALDGYGVGTDFARRIFTHGDAPLHLSETKKSQLIVSLKNLELGRAGQKQFAFDNGALGAYGFILAEFAMQLWVPWPTPKGGLSAQQAADDALMAASATLDKATFIAFSALRALSQGGITTDPPVCPIVQDNMLVGPAQPIGPDGSFAGYEITVQLQY